MHTRLIAKMQQLFNEEEQEDGKKRQQVINNREITHPTTKNRLESEPCFSTGNVKWQEDLYTLIQPNSFDTSFHGPSQMIIFICDDDGTSHESVFMYVPRSCEEPAVRPYERVHHRVIKRASLIPGSEDTVRLLYCLLFITNSHVIQIIYPIPS